MRFHDMVSARAGNVIGGGDTKYFRLDPGFGEIYPKKEKYNNS